MIRQGVGCTINSITCVLLLFANQVTKPITVVFTSHCEAYRHESISRGLEKIQSKKNRSYMLSRYGYVLRQGDPYYNRNLMR